MVEYFSAMRWANYFYEIGGIFFRNRCRIFSSTLLNSLFVKLSVINKVSLVQFKI